ncbi:MAG: iron-containing alcohol dehydrogenase [Treponema sp.]|jgi:alcohol dehydrogenase|nr:iron-containing alcohol dehydrogenase [Treponema sp.]
MTDMVFKLDPEIIAGEDTLNRAGAVCAAIGKRALIVTEKALYSNRGIERLTAILADSGIEAILYDETPAQAAGNVAESAAELARGGRCSAVIALGGLKTQAIGRAAAIIAPSRLTACDFLDGAPAPEPFLPYIAIPTTGRDPFLFTNYFILADPRDRSVKQVKSPPGLCRAALFDGNLSEGLSNTVAAAVAFDGFSVAVEAYCSNRSRFAAEPLLEQAISRYARLIDSAAEAQAGESRSQDLIQAGVLMALGAAISSPGIGAALSYALNGRFPASKSWCSTVLLPRILERLAAARPEKIARVAALMGEAAAGLSTAEAAALAAGGIRRRMEALQVPSRLRDFDISLDRLVPVAETARNLEFAAASPWTVTAEDAYSLLKQAY